MVCSIDTKELTVVVLAFLLLLYCDNFQASHAEQSVVSWPVKAGGGGGEGAC